MRAEFVRRLFALLLCMAIPAAFAGEPTRPLPRTPAAESSPVLAGHVLRVIDGDTLDVRLASGRIRVRLHGIDAPERDQPGGAAASAWLTARVQDRAVTLEPVSQDQYDRLVAQLHLDDVNINQAMVAAGHAWAYRRYLRRAERDWCEVEARARQARSGLWAGETPRAPWEFRATRARGPFTDYTATSAADCQRAMGRQGNARR